MARLLSGIQPTGTLHVGNYLGALRNWVALQAQYECFYSVVDLHALTVPSDPATFRQKTLETAIGLLGCGIDPARATLFVQSDVPEHTELAWILSCVAPLGELERMTQFKEKSDQHRKNVNLGLFAYPVLQAADILVYRAEVVPVGEDQVQHLELTREIARRFNARFGQVFPEPKPLLTATPRIMGLDGKEKMSKSKGNGLDLTEADAAIRAKLKTAATDPARVRRADAGDPAKCPTFTLHEGFSPPATCGWAAAGCRAASIGCIECKGRLADHVVETLAPIRARITDLTAHPDRVWATLAEGARRCRAIAAATMADVRRAIGISA
jgi:tryptophanyl-tRNA synthetase